MQLFFSVAAVLLTACCAQEERLISRRGLESKHGVVKRDLAEADVELILKALMAKMEHSSVDSELIHKKVGVDREHYFHEPEKPHHSGMKELDMKYLSAGHPIEHEYVKEVPAEKDMMALLMKIKELSAAKSSEDSYKKEMHGMPEEKFISEKVHLSKDPVMMEKSEKMLEKDKFNDKDVSLAESLYHMKMAGDIETYPTYKLEHLMQEKKTGEETFLEKDRAIHASADEAYLKKVDEIGKSLLKEETYPYHKEDDIGGYLKKAAEEEKAYYEPKIAHSGAVLKSAEEKALEAWKASHKDLFAEGGLILDEKLKAEGVHFAEEGFAHGISDDLLKKLKASLGVDKELGKEHEELLLHLAKELHKEAGIEEGSFAYEKAKEQAHKDAHVHLSEEELKKHLDEALALGVKEKGHGTEFLFEKGLGEEKIHGINTKIGAGMEKSFHEMMGEEALKSKEAHAFDESFGYAAEKEKFGGKLPLEGEIKHGISHEAASEAEKAFKAHEEEFLKKGKTFEADLHTVHEEEILKKEKGFGIDSFLHKAHEDEILKKEKAYGTDDFLHKAHEEELLKKEKALGTDAFLHKGHEEEILKKDKTHGVDAFLHKAHEDELFRKEHGVDAHKFHDDELIKKEIAYGSDPMFHKNKEILEGADHHLHHGIKHEEGVLHGTAAGKHHIEEGIIGAEKSHKTFRDLKDKFLELLKRVLHRKCHLVTMRPGELLSIVNCISISKDPLLCEKFVMCQKKMPIRVIENLEKCQKETIPGEVKKCTKYAPLFPNKEIPLKIFQCVAISTGELKPEEKKHMIDFEECARVIKAESCGRFKFFPRPH